MKLHTLTTTVLTLAFASSAFAAGTGLPHDEGRALLTQTRLAQAAASPKQSTRPIVSKVDFSSPEALAPLSRSVYAHR